MRECLHLLLLALVLIDLAFVQATGIVSGQDLLPLWLLAAASPWLRRLQRFAACRLTWNLGVLLVFALLVQHATTTGLLHMLEDGLLLAVLCQVHLQNNVGERQRPDLVFFNSFLIAFVTSLFAPDLAWSLLFALHTLVFVPALQVNVLARGPAGAAPGLLRALLRDTLPRVGVLGAATAAVFALWPRDFQRKGWLEESLTLRQHFEAGFAEQIRLDHELPMHLGAEVVMRIAPASRRAEHVPLHWRGVAFTVFEGSAWLPQDARQLGSRFATDPAWEAQGAGTWRRGRGAPCTPQLAVQLLNSAGQRLFSPLTACHLRIDAGPGLLPDPRSDGVLAFVRAEGAPRAAIDYTVGLGADLPRVAPTAHVRGQLLALPDTALPQALRDLAARLLLDAKGNHDPAALAKAGCAWLQSHRRYELPGGPGFARNLGEFLVGTGAGHCEYFATALALLLRLQEVPCRLVGGYLAHEWDDAAGAMIVRARDAHAWVEVLQDDGEWRTFDPTPEASVEGPRDSHGTFWEAGIERLRGLWSGVVGFDQSTRERAFAALCDLPRAALRWPGAIVSLLALLAALHYVRRRRRQSLPAIVELLDAARAAGLSLRVGETPRGLLARAAAAAIPTKRLAALEAATRHHEAARYGGQRGVLR